jgi:glycosyltransferase involved in cell wall biosynthesis
MIVAGIPAYNEEKTIAKIIVDAQKQVDAVVVCDDGSQDMTAEIAQRLGAVVIRHTKNLGYGKAINALFEKAKALNADLLVTIDADDQHNAKEIQLLIQPVIEGKVDIAIGSRLLNGANGLPLYRRLGIKFLTRITNGRKTEQSLTDAQCGFRAYNKRAIENLDLREPGMGISVEILRQAKNQGMIIAEVPVEARYRGLDTSTHNPLSHGVSVLSTIIKHVVEENPLVYLGIPAVFAITTGITVGIWDLHLYSYLGYLITNIFLVSIALTMSGMFTLFTALTLFAMQARNQGMIIAEVPVEARYRGLDTSNHDSVNRGMRVLSKIIRIVIEESPLVYLGIPAIFTIMIGIAFGIWTLQLYSALGYIVTNVFLISIASTLLGVFALFTAIVLFAIIRQRERLVQRLNRAREKA